MVSTPQINLRKDGCTIELIQQIIKSWNGNRYSTVILLTVLLSTYILQDPSFFGTSRAGTRAGNRAGRAVLGRANSGLGQNRVGPKLARFFLSKILVAQPALKTGLIEPNGLLKAKKIQAGRVGPYRAGPYWPGPNLAQFFSGQ